MRVEDVLQGLQKGRLAMARHSGRVGEADGFPLVRAHGATIMVNADDALPRGDEGNGVHVSKC